MPGKEDRVSNEHRKTPKSRASKAGYVTLKRRRSRQEKVCEGPKFGGSRASASSFTDSGQRLAVLNWGMSHGTAHASDVDSSDARLGNALQTCENSSMYCKTK